MEKNIRIKVNWEVLFLPLLFFILLIFKLSGHLACSWWLVTVPLWGPFALLGLIAVVLFLFGLFMGIWRIVRKRISKKAEDSSPEQQK
jgi:uncharacterized membrane protein YqjE